MPATTLIHYAGRAGDHSDGAMTASPLFAAELASRLNVAPVVVGKRSPFENAGWEKELSAVHAPLTEVSRALDSALAAGTYPVIACSRCTVALATLPIIAKHHPDVLVVWFDAHADMNTPAASASGFIGGMALSGPLGLWDSGLGAGIKQGSVVLAGTRDIDDTEWPVIKDGTARLVPPGPDFVRNLAKEVAGREVFVHIDCDVLSPGQLPTDYSVPDGLTLADLHAAAEAIVGAAKKVVGIEIGELEAGEKEEVTKEKARVLAETVAPFLQPTSGR